MKNFDFYTFATGFIFGFATLLFFNKCQPQAIDVYKGRTTLEITYKDNVPVDSFVVFK